MDAESKVWGCLECGAFIEELTAEGFCPACKEGLVAELGGDPTPDRAQALVAWAGPDATEIILKRLDEIIANAHILYRRCELLERRIRELESIVLPAADRNSL